MKNCGECKESFPKTEKYFFTKKYKQKKTNGEINVYTCFRSTCKNCHSIITKRFKRKQRCKEMGWDIKNYKDESNKHMAMVKLKHKELYGLSEGTRNGLRKKIDNGYIYTTYEQHRIDCSINQGLARRKYSYYKGNGLVDKKLKNRSGIINLTDAYIAMTLGFKVNEVPKEVIETKRLYLELKREIKTTQYGK